MTSGRSLFKNQDYIKIKDKCLKSGELFEDEFFQHDVQGATWLRPKDIVDDPRFFVGGASRFDVRQGANAGCWLLTAMANLTMNPAMFEHVVPKDQRFTDNYAGIFRFNIWQCGTWVEVVVDDMLPTKTDDSGEVNLIFVHSKQKNEFWSALLEKAYAKLYGSYNELTVGYFSEGMVDFTGGIVERIELSPPPQDLGNFICKSLEKSSFICVFMKNDPSVHELLLSNGLVKGHAYGITKARTVSVGGNSVLLFRLRNPWGRIEWNGAWSDGSPEWNSIPAEEKRRIGLVADNDGEFWMSFYDFVNNFEKIDICHLSPDSFSTKSGEAKIGWESHFFKGEWTRGVSAGGFYGETFHLNPQYRIVLTDADDDTDSLCTLIIGLMQRNKTRKVWHRIGFTAFRLEGPEKQSKERLSNQYLMNHFKTSSSCEFKAVRENVVRDKWELGDYCIIPSTYKPTEEGQYLLRVYSEKKSSMVEHDVISTEPLPESVHDEPSHDKPVQKVPVARTSLGTTLFRKSEKEISEYFNKVAGDENEVSWQGLQDILEYALKDTKSAEESTGVVSTVIGWFKNVIPGLSEKMFSKDECRLLIDMLDDDRSGKMSYKEFQILWRKLTHWELVFLNYSDKNNKIESNNLGKALKEIDPHLMSSHIGRFARKYSDGDGKISFDDFIMCCGEMFVSM